MEPVPLTCVPEDSIGASRPGGTRCEANVVVRVTQNDSVIGTETDSGIRGLGMHSIVGEFVWAAYGCFTQCLGLYQHP